jgi:hypothetical protein
MSSRSDRCLAKAQECQRISDAAETSGTKRLYGALASQWRQLAEDANRTDNHREIDEVEDAIRGLGALTLQEHRS